MYRRIIAILLLLFTCSTVALADESSLLIYCEYPAPTTFEKGSKGGLIYDQVWELMKRTGVKEPVQTVSWKRGYEEALMKPGVALFPTTRTKEREELFHWVGPILRLSWVFYKHADSGLVINSLEDAKAVRSIGTYANDSKEQWLTAQGFTNLVSVMDNVTNLKKLYNRRIDLMVGSPSVTDQWPEQFGLDPSKLELAYSFKTVDLYLAISKKTPVQTVKVLQEVFAEMMRDGTVQKLYDRRVPGLIPPTVE